MMELLNDIENQTNAWNIYSLAKQAMISGWWEIASLLLQKTDSLLSNMDRIPNSVTTWISTLYDLCLYDYETLFQSLNDAEGDPESVAETLKSFLEDVGLLGISFSLNLAYPFLKIVPNT
jgi:hypothetical protein